MDRADIGFGMVVLEGLNAVALVKFRKMLCKVIIIFHLVLLDFGYIY